MITVYFVDCGCLLQITEAILSFSFRECVHIHMIYIRRNLMCFLLNAKLHIILCEKAKRTQNIASVNQTISKYSMIWH